jgi:flagellum-specific peptidoglycan hydrolase FlgJ
MAGFLKTFTDKIKSLKDEYEGKKELRGYQWQSLLNQIPFVNNDDKENIAYLRARGENMNRTMGRDNLPNALQAEYDSGNTNIESIIDQASKGANYNIYPGEGFSTHMAPNLSSEYEVLGVQAPTETPSPLMDTMPIAKVPTVVKTPKKTKIPVYSQEQRNKVINRFLSNASAVDPSLPHRRTPEKAKENSAFVKEYLNNVFDTAPKYNLDPVLLTAIAAQESGWGGQRYGKNLMGYGKFEVGKSLDTDYSEKSIPNAVDALLKKVSTDWGGQYRGKSTPKEYVKGKYKWNVHPSWVTNVDIIRNKLMN